MRTHKTKRLAHMTVIVSLNKTFNKGGLAHHCDGYYKQGECGMISIIVPTYNENENIKKLIPSVHQTLKEHEYELIVVDDNSPDGTARTAEDLSKNYPVRVLKRKDKQGLGSAVLHGFQHAKGDILGVIDADLQHPPEYIKDLVHAVSNGQDIAIKSLHIKRGET